MTLHSPLEAPTAERGNAKEGGGKVGVRSQGRTSAREVVGISNFTERGLTRPTRGGEKLGQPPCVTSLPAAKTDADVEHRRALSFPVHPFKRCHLGIPRTMGEGRGEGGGFRHITSADYQARSAEYVTQSPSRHIPFGIQRPFRRYLSLGPGSRK